jgi:hypothetical protein
MFRKHLLVVGLTVLGLVGASAWASGQLRVPEPVNPPIVLSGSDVGFRIESRAGDTVYGRIVVRIKGEWIAVGDSGGVRRIGRIDSAPETEALPVPSGY